MIFGIVTFLGGVFFTLYFVFGSEGNEPSWTVFVFCIIPLLLGGWVIFRKVRRF